MILVLAGTGEGRMAAVSMEKKGLDVMASTATGYGKELLAREFKGEITARPLALEDMVRLIRDKNIHKIVDATHPFAREVTFNARKACRQQGITYERLERLTDDIEDEKGVIKARSIEEAVSAASAHTGVIFLTTGSSRLEQYTKALDPERLVVRILPLRSSLEKCIDLGISPRNIVAMQGPFDEALNYHLFKRYRASLVITKNSGAAGGTREKVSAARRLSLPVIVICKPDN